MINQTLRRLAVGASAITVLGVVVPVAAATNASAATSVSGLTAQPSPNTAGATAQYNVNFTTSASGALASGTGTIMLMLPTDTVLPTAPSSYVVNGVAASTATQSGQTETITTPVAIGNSSLVNLTVNGAKNPTTPGPYTASLYTSSDTGPVASPPYTIAAMATAPQSFTINSVSPSSAGSKAVYQTSLTPSSSGALAAGSGTITLSGPTGTVFPLVASDYTVSGIASTVTPTQTAANNVTFTTPVDVAASTATKVVAAGVTNPAAGNGQTYSASTSSDTTPKTTTVNITAAAGSQVTNVTGPSPSTSAAGATANYTYGFTATTAIPVGGTITLTGPTGTTFPAGGASYTVNGVPATTATLSNSNATVQLTLANSSALAAGSTVTVVATGVTNPAAGTYTGTVATSTDTTPASTPSYTITGAPSAVTNVTGPAPAPASAGSSAQYTVGFKTTTAVPAGGTITVATTPTGTKFPSTATSYTVNGIAAATVTGGGSDTVTVTTPVALAAGGTDTLVANGVTNPPAGSYTLKLSTSTDTTPVASAGSPYTIGAAAAPGVSGLTFSPSANTPGTTGVTDTIKFTTSATGALAAGTDTITLASNNGQVLPTTITGTYTVNGQTATTVTGAPGSTVVITTPKTVPLSTPVEVDVTGVINGLPGNYAFQVSTNKDTTAASAPYTITGGMATQGTVNSVDVSPSNAGAQATYTIGYTPGTALPAGGTITVTAPTGTSFPSTASSYVVDGVSSAGPVTGGGSNTVTFTSPTALPTGTQATFTIVGVTNPTTTSTTDTLTVATSTDTTPATSPAYSITAANTAVTGVTGPTPTPATAAATAATYTVGFTATSALTTSDTITLTAPTGTSFPHTASNYTVNNVAATLASGANSNVVSITVPQAITAGSTVTVKVINVTNPAAGSYTLAVHTSADLTDANTPSYTITAGSGTSITGTPTVNVTPNTAGGSATYRVGNVTPTTAVPAGGTITLTAPTGTVFPLVAADYTIDGVVPTTAPTQTAPNTVTLTTVEPLAAGTAHEIDAINVTNPSAGSGLTLTVATSTDTTPVKSDTYVIVAASTAPQVTSVTPNTGSFQGGTTVTIKGSNLGDASTATVTFGANTASIVSDDGTTLVVTSPAGTAGQTVPVTVTVGGQSNGAGSANFTYTSATSDYLPQTPSRILSNQVIAANSSVPFTLPSSVPAGSGAVALNLTAVHPNTVGNLRVNADCGSSTPTSTSILNYQPGEDTANFVIVPLQCAAGSAPVRTIDFYSANSGVTVDVDLAGTYPTTTTGTGSATVYTTPGFTGITPVRDVTQQSIPANTSKKFTLTDVPAGAKAVAINVTSIHQPGEGNLRVYPGDQNTVPTTSNVNFIPGVDKAGFVIINLPADKTINIFSAGSTDSVDVDVFGAFPAGASTTGLAQPVRVLNTRTGSGVTQGLPDPLQIGTPYNVTVTGNGVPADATAVVVSLTTIHAAGSSGVGNLRAYPAGGSTPTVSNINYISPKADVANLAIVRVGANGQITLVTNGSVIDAAVDVLGYVPAATP